MKCTPIFFFCGEQELLRQEPSNFKPLNLSSVISKLNAASQEGKTLQLASCQVYVNCYKTELYYKLTSIKKEAWKEDYSAIKKCQGRWQFPLWNR